MKTMLFNPYIGTPRHPFDIASDPSGILMLEPDEQIRATIAQPVQPKGDAKDAELLDFIDAASGTIRSDVLFGGLMPRYVHWGNGKNMRDSIRAAIEQSEQPVVCKKCGGAMAPGQAIAQTFGGTNDFIGDKTVCTISPCGPGKLVSCMKCKSCGWSTS